MNTQMDNRKAVKKNPEGMAAGELVAALRSGGVKVPRLLSSAKLRQVYRSELKVIRPRQGKQKDPQFAEYPIVTLTASVLQPTREQGGLMDIGRKHICPVELAGHLDSKIRRWVQNPGKILRPYVKEGMTILEVGCGPGFFTLDLAWMAGETGRVIACDLQEGMLDMVRGKISGTELQQRITLHRCEEDRIGVSGTVDFVLAFYVVHEVPDQDAFFREMHGLLNPQGQALVVEPSFHVSRAAFERTVEKARAAGLTPVQRPGMLLSRAVLLRKV